MTEETRGFLAKKANEAAESMAKDCIRISIEYGLRFPDRKALDPDETAFFEAELTAKLEEKLSSFCGPAEGGKDDD